MTYIDTEEFLRLLEESQKRVSFSGYIDDDGISHKSIIEEADTRIKDYLSKSNMTETDKAKNYTSLMQNVVTSTTNTLIQVLGDIIKSDQLIGAQAEKEKREAIALEWEIYRKIAEAAKMQKEAGVNVTKTQITNADGSISYEFDWIDTQNGLVDKEIALKGKELEIAEAELEIKTAQVAIAQKELELAEKKVWAIKYEALQNLAQAHSAGAGAAERAKNAGASVLTDFDNNGEPRLSVTWNNGGIADKEIALKAAQTEAIAQNHAKQLEIAELNAQTQITAAYINATGDYPPSYGG